MAVALVTVLHERAAPPRIYFGLRQHSGGGHATRGAPASVRDDACGWLNTASCGHRKQIVDAGFVDRLFLSTDTVLSLLLLPAETYEEREKTNPDGMLFNTRTLIPYLKKIGISRREIDTITVKNPRRFFARSEV